MLFLYRNVVLFTLLSFFILGCTSSTPILIEEDGDEVLPGGAEPIYSVYLLGNIGANISRQSNPVRGLLRQHLEMDGSKKSVVFLGNNIPCCGFPDVSDPERERIEWHLTRWIEAGKTNGSRVFFIPGHYESLGEYTEDHGWASLEAFIEEQLDSKDAFLPSNGFPGPVGIELAEGITLIALDTQYWMNGYQVPPDSVGTDVKEPTDVLIELRNVLFEYRDNQMLFVAHHPLFSNGNYGGRFSLKQYLFPVPLLSGLVPLYRTLIGRRQDLGSTSYRLFRNEMLAILQEQHNIIYAAAHDRGLQYFRKDNRRRVQHHIGSGSAAGSAFISKGHGVDFATSDLGFTVVEFYKRGEVWLKVWTAVDENSTGILRYSMQLVEPAPLLATKPDGNASAASLREVEPDYRDSTVVRAINPNYAEVGRISRFFFGKQYRALWATPIEVPVLDLSREAGGLTPIKLGGQSQSVTMRLAGGDGDFYMLRSIDKVATRSLSPAMRRTFARNIIQDQVAMMHPYGAFIIPPLSDAAGIFHTNPKLVFVPEDSRIGNASDFLTNRVVLFEERPDEDMSDKASFGYSKNIIGSEKLFSEINGDNDHRVEARSFARARLFDMLIADHDRTLDNFRWATYEPYELYPGLTGEERTQGKIYVPVPRDRDKAFAKVDGLFPSLYRYLAEPAWQPFSKRYGYVNGLNRKGIALDRRFTPSLTRQDWITIAEEIKAGLTDEVIEKAVLEWPEPIQEKAAEEMVEVLKVRRDQLPGIADRYARTLDQVVDVIGSNKHERFDVTRLDSEKTNVVVYKTSKEGDVRKEIYHRTFLHGDTKEVRLFGFDGNDQFNIGGVVDTGLRIIAVGGAGDDAFRDSSLVRRGRRKTWIYDIPEGTVVQPGQETKSHLELSPEVNEYEFEGYKPDLIRPVAFFGANPDDGLFIGTGFKWTRHGFRKNPHAATHQFMGNYAVRTSAFNVRYLGNFVSVIEDWDLDIDLGFLNPNNIRNFYGLGNETADTEKSRRFYQARFSNVYVNTAVVRSFESGITFRIGPTFEYTDVKNESDRFIGQPQAGISIESFDRLAFAGIETSLDVLSVDNRQSPMQGFAFNTSSDLNIGVSATNDSFLKLFSSLTIYMSPSLSPQATLAFRIGGAHNVGPFPFFESNTLGGKHNLRGYRSTRFAGRTSLYQNAELRLQLAEFSGYLGYGRLGLTAFFDNGRVWTDGESSRIWHQGYGGGLWINYFEQFLVSTEVGFSRENPTFTLRLGFLY